VFTRNTLRHEDGIPKVREMFLVSKDAAQTSITLAGSILPKKSAVELRMVRQWEHRDGGERTRPRVLLPAPSPEDGIATGWGSLPEGKFHRG
jgi:hypothetical protein